MTLLNKTEKKASTENIEFKGITILFVEDIRGQRYIKEPHLCDCLEVEGVSEVCLNTNRILGQHPVRGWFTDSESWKQIKTKKHEKQQMST